VKSWSEMSRQAIDRKMAEQFRDQQPDPRRDPERVFDMSNRRDVDDYMTFRVEGQEFEDAGTGDDRDDE
jgi:hypothetical protein